LPRYGRRFIVVLASIATALMVGGLALWLPQLGEESTANSALGIALLGGGLAVLAGAAVSYGALAVEQELQRLQGQISEIATVLGGAVEKVTHEESALSPAELARRKDHWDQYDAWMQSLSPSERFKAQRENSVVYLNQYGASVRQIKRALRVLGYYSGADDDNFTVDFAQAIEKFQRSNEMQYIDGMIGQITLREIRDKFMKSTGSEMKDWIDNR
jgi:hypothetical protein